MIFVLGSLSTVRAYLYEIKSWGRGAFFLNKEVKGHTILVIMMGVPNFGNGNGTAKIIFAQIDFDQKYIHIRYNENIIQKHNVPVQIRE